MSIYQRTFSTVRQAISAFVPPAELPHPATGSLMSDLGLKADRLDGRNLCPKGLSVLCSEPGGQTGSLVSWVDGFGGRLMVAGDPVPPVAWFREHAAELDFCIIDADLFGDVGDTADFCLRLRRAAPELPVILISSEVRGHDLTAERMFLCDATLRSPFTRIALSQGIQAAYQNHSYFRSRHASCS